MQSADFHARACTTSFWLCHEIMNGSLFVPLLIAAAGCRLNPVPSIAGVDALGSEAASGGSAVATPTFGLATVSSSIDTEDHAAGANGMPLARIAEIGAFTASVRGSGIQPSARSV